MTQYDSRSKTQSDNDAIQVERERMGAKRKRKRKAKRQRHHILTILHNTSPMCALASRAQEDLKQLEEQIQRQGSKMELRKKQMLLLLHLVEAALAGHGPI